MPSDMEIDRQMQAQWTAIERVKEDVRKVSTEHAVINHKVSDLSVHLQAVRDTLSENHGMLMASMQDVKNDLSEFKIQTARELGANDGQKKGKSDASAGTVAIVGTVCAIIGALIAIIGVTQGIGG